MAILIDMHGTMIANILAHARQNETEIDIQMIRHMILNSIRMYRSKFLNHRDEEFVLCCDDTNFWRKDVFPYYKAHRKVEQEKSGYNWNLIFQSMNQVKQELKENFPYKLIQVDRAEADDIIAVLTKFLVDEKKEPVLIISADKDFVQLQTMPDIRQFSPTQDKFLSDPDPAAFLKRQIIKGDRSDGIPNILSPDDAIIDRSIRQKPVFEKRLVEWVKQEPWEFCETDEMKHGWNRNEKLIDLSFIPMPIQKRILESYNVPITDKRSGLFQFFIDHNLKDLMEDLQEF